MINLQRGEDVDDDLWMLIHECHGTCHREFTVGEFYEMWTRCDCCGDWWLNAAINLRAFGRLHLEVHDEDVPG